MQLQRGCLSLAERPLRAHKEDQSFANLTAVLLLKVKGRALWLPRGL